jgi:8-oxo-dGTP pyrophosphatase MutT (NUDIX family)
MGEFSTKMQVSAGGVAFRQEGGRVEVVLISVGEDRRWQLPKGLVNRGETPEQAALREVREEAGIETELVDFLDKIEYWYFAKRGGSRVRFHKFVHFFLLRYLSGDVNDHDQEVNEARWLEIDQAIETLTFEDEQELVRKARETLKKGDADERGHTRL